MNYYISHACIAEDGTVYGKTAGDNTGREVRNDMLGSDGNNWSLIFRCTDRPTAIRIAKLAKECADNNFVGYTQTLTSSSKYATRTGLFDAIKAYGSPDKIIVPVNCDCSSMVAACVYYAGVLSVSKSMTTSTEDAMLLATKYFTKMSYQKDKVELGDILWKQGHTSIVSWGDDFALWHEKKFTQAELDAAIKKAVESAKPKEITLMATTDLNMRSGAGVINKVVATIPKNGKVKATGNKKTVLGSEWVEIIYSGITGWSNSKYLTEVK